MKSIQSKNIIQNSSNHSPFFQQGSSDFFSGKKDKPFLKPLTDQAKLTVNQPNDPFEKEADSMADKVVQRLNYKSFSGLQNDRAHFSNKSSSLVRRKCAACEQEEKNSEKGLS